MPVNQRSNPNRPDRRDPEQYATQASVDALEEKVAELHQGLLGSDAFPGGRIGAIETTIKELPGQMLEAWDDKHRINARQARIDLGKFLIGAFTGAAGLVVVLPPLAQFLTAVFKAIVH